MKSKRCAIRREDGSSFSSSCTKTTTTTTTTKVWTTTALVACLSAGNIHAYQPGSSSSSSSSSARMNKRRTSSAAATTKTTSNSKRTQLPLYIDNGSNSTTTSIGIPFLPKLPQEQQASSSFLPTSIPLTTEDSSSAETTTTTSYTSTIMEHEISDIRSLLVQLEQYMEDPETKGMKRRKIESAYGSARASLLLLESVQLELAALENLPEEEEEEEEEEENLEEDQWYDDEEEEERLPESNSDLNYSFTSGWDYDAALNGQAESSPYRIETVTLETTTTRMVPVVNTISPHPPMNPPPLDKMLEVVMEQQQEQQQEKPRPRILSATLSMDTDVDLSQTLVLKPPPGEQQQRKQGLGGMVKAFFNQVKNPNGKKIMNQPLPVLEADALVVRPQQSNHLFLYTQKLQEMVQQKNDEVLYRQMEERNASAAELDEEMEIVFEEEEEEDQPDLIYEDAVDEEEEDTIVDEDTALFEEDTIVEDEQPELIIEATLEVVPEQPDLIYQATVDENVDTIVDEDTALFVEDTALFEEDTALFEEDNMVDEEEDNMVDDNTALFLQDMEEGSSLLDDNLFFLKPATVQEKQDTDIQLASQKNDTSSLAVTGTASPKDKKGKTSNIIPKVTKVSFLDVHLEEKKEKTEQDEELEMFWEAHSKFPKTRDLSQFHPKNDGTPHKEMATFSSEPAPLQPPKELATFSSGTGSLTPSKEMATFSSGTGFLTPPPVLTSKIGTQAATTATSKSTPLQGQTAVPKRDSPSGHAVDLGKDVHPANTTKTSEPQQGLRRPTFLERVLCPDNIAPEVTLKKETPLAPLADVFLLPADQKGFGTFEDHSQTVVAKKVPPSMVRRAWFHGKPKYDISRGVPHFVIKSPRGSTTTAIGPHESIRSANGSFHNQSDNLIHHRRTQVDSSMTLSDMGGDADAPSSQNSSHLGAADWTLPPPTFSLSPVTRRHNNSPIHGQQQTPIRPLLSSPQGTTKAMVGGSTHLWTQLESTMTLGNNGDTGAPTNIGTGTTTLGASPSSVTPIHEEHADHKTATVLPTKAYRRQRLIPDDYSQWYNMDWRMSGRYEHLHRGGESLHYHGLN